MERRSSSSSGPKAATPFDVVVVGGGGSGLAAAASAAEQGLRVLVLEKQPELGGTTGIAVGSFTANRTSLQRAAGIEDALEAHVEDAGRFASPEIEARNHAALRRFFLEQSRETFQWLLGLGLKFHGPHAEPPNRQPRMHNVVPGAKAYIVALQRQIQRHGGTIWCQAAVERLCRRDNRISGVEVRVQGQLRTIEARRGVVLAAGDYANAPAWIARFKGPQFAQIEGINPHAGGDGHQLVEAVGGQLLNMDVTYGPELRFIPPPRTIQQLLPAGGWLHRLLGWVAPFAPRPLLRAFVKRLIVTWQHPENALFDDGAILVNRQGRRFCDETRWPDREIAVSHQMDKICYLLLDERIAARYQAWPHFISTAPQIAYAYVADYLRLRPDVATVGRTLTEVARARNLDSVALSTTVDQYNEIATRGGTDLFGRGPLPAPLIGNRWVLLGPAKAYFTTTEGGAAINCECQVLDAHGQPIPGLYAVGQNGLGGQILWGHGLHIAWALTSGRLVGLRLAQLPDHSANQPGDD